MIGPRSEDDRIVELDDDRLPYGAAGDVDQEAAAGVVVDNDDRYLLDDLPPHWG